MKKYLLCPGHVVSKTDGQQHYITASQLAKLYGVPMDECLIRPETGTPKHFGWDESHQLIELWPQTSGDYALPHNTHYPER